MIHCVSPWYTRLPAKVSLAREWHVRCLPHMTTNLMDRVTQYSLYLLERRCTWDTIKNTIKQLYTPARESRSLIGQYYCRQRDEDRWALIRDAQFNPAEMRTSSRRTKNLIHQRVTIVRLHEECRSPFIKSGMCRETESFRGFLPCTECRISQMMPRPRLFLLRLLVQRALASRGPFGVTFWLIRPSVK